MFGMNLDTATAQFAAGPRLGNQVYEPDSFRRVAADLNVGLPGRLWVSSNFADEGLGYNGSYLTVGGKTRLGEDFLDGRWLTEARLHHSIEDDGGFFANVGVERVFSIKPAGAEVSTGFWYDFDGDQQGNFGHDFSQVGVNAAIKTRRWDLIGNGYFPVGIRNYVSDATAGGSFFQGNNILLTPGIDSAQTGFDVTLRMRPKQLAFMNGTFEVGGYGYSSDLVNSFGGGRLRMTAQTQRGLIVSAEVNHDDRFETTGLLSVGYVFGSVGGRNSEYAGIGRDLEETSRNDHIVRFNQSVVLAIDPSTGAAYNVVHVADGAADGGDGTVENPYDTLFDVQANSEAGDVIFVAAGGTLDGGIILKDRQQLLGEGTEQIISIQDNRLFRLGEDTGGNAVLTNTNGANVVRLADDNTVRGLVINGSGATNGISGNLSNNGTLESNVITGAGESGILLSRITGDWNINNNTLNGNSIDGLWVRATTDPSSTFTVTGNTANGNGFDGIHFQNFEAQQLSLTDNTTNNNGRDGVRLTDYQTAGGQIDFLGHTADSNGEFGIVVDGGDGNLNFINSTITNNIGGGIRTVNFTSTGGQQTLVGNFDGGVSVIENNGVATGANLEFELLEPGLMQDILVTGLSIDGGGRGIFANAVGDGTVINLDILDVLSISENTGDGIRILADGGATVNANIINETTNPLQMFNNGQTGGSNIFIAATGDATGPMSRINTTIRNVDINLPGSSAFATGVNVNSTGNASTRTIIRDVDIEKSLVANIAAVGVSDGDVGVSLNFANSGGATLNLVDIEDTRIVADNGVRAFVGSTTKADITIEQTVIQGVSANLPGEEDRATNAPFNDTFGDIGISVEAFGDQTTAAADSLTRLTITDVLIRDFAGSSFPDLNNVGSFNGIGYAQEGSAVNIATFGDANLLLNFRNNRIFNNGAGTNNDVDNDGVFNENTSATQSPTQLYFVDAVKINAFDFSRVTSSISNNLFQDNFERGLALETYQGAELNARIVNNAFNNNDRGEDANNDVPNSTLALTDSGIFDFEAINNEEFFLRDYENPFGLDDTGTIIDDNDDDLPDINRNTFINAGAANMCIDLSNNLFQLNTNIIDFSTFGNFQLGLDGTTNNIGQFFPGVSSGGFGLCDQLISIDEAFFAQNGFAGQDH